MKSFFLILTASMLLVLAGFSVGVAWITTTELAYPEREKIALEWMAKHQDKWRYTLCNTPMDGK